MAGIDPGLANWLRSPALLTKADNAGLAANVLARGVEQEIGSPLATKAAADSEAVRQLAFLGGPLAVDKHNVPGWRSDLVARPVTIKADRLGYSAGVAVFVISAEELPGERTLLTVLRKLT